MNQKLKINKENLEKFCLKNDFSWQTIEELSSDAINIFSDVLYVEVNSDQEKIYIDISTNMSDRASYRAKEKLMDSWNKNYNEKLLDLIEIYITTFEDGYN